MEIKNNTLIEDSKKIIRFLTYGLTLVLVCLATFLIAQTYNTLSSGSKYPPNTITLGGQGEVVALPDTATFNYSVREVADRVEIAQEAATIKSNRIIEILKQKGIDENDIKTISYNIRPRYEWQQDICVPGQPCRGGQNVLIGYEVSQTVQVKVRDTDNAGEIISEIGRQEVSNLSNLIFLIDDEDALKAEAREIAIKDAMEKAENLAGKLGVKIKKVVGFHEDSGEYYPIGMSGDAIFRTESAQIGAPPDLPTGENIVKSRVYITFEIRG